MNTLMQFYDVLLEYEKAIEKEAECWNAIEDRAEVSEANDRLTDAIIETYKLQKAVTVLRTAIGKI